VVLVQLSALVLVWLQAQAQGLVGQVLGLVLAQAVAQVQAMG
jgi:hypothetical protein